MNPKQRFLLFGILAAWMCGVVSPVGQASETSRAVLVIERPSDTALRGLALRADVDVRWVERGLVVFEMTPGAPPAGSRLVILRPPGLELGILRGSDMTHLRPKNAANEALARFAVARRVGRFQVAAGETWLLLAPAASWPEELVGCHGGLVLPAHGIDPRAAIDAGPPTALQRWLKPGLLTPAEQRVLATVSPESLQANVARMALNGAVPADRYVFHPDLDALYAPRILNAMQRAVSGIAAATVTSRPFPMRRSTAQTIDAHNLVARLPGSVPGTGTFVVCGHVDATGSRDPVWRQTVQQGGAVVTPGAEDNATGVACMLEVLRCVADGVRTGTLDFAFDLEFVAFSGEEVPVSPSPEQGLVGSVAYVSAATASATPLLGCLNSDMVGYDSIPGNLQIVHNPASRFLAEVVRDGALGLVPPTPLHLTLEIDESRASDHNSFWNANVPALLAADATVDRLRRYESYHKPIDQVQRVDTNKMVEVTRVLLAGLLQFDTQAHSSSEVLFAPEDLELRRTIDGTDVQYRPGFHRLYPGVPFATALQVHSLGARYMGPLQVHLETRSSSGTDAFFDSLASVDLPTGDRVSMRVPVPVRSADLGWRTLVARVTANDSAGVPLATTHTDSFYVDANQQGDLNLKIMPNPVQHLEDAQLAFDLLLPGELSVQVFDLEGQRVASDVRSVEPRVTTAKITMPLLQAGNSASSTALASGAYIVSVVWHGTDGATTANKATLVIQR